MAKTGGKKVSKKREKKKSTARKKSSKKRTARATKKSSNNSWAPWRWRFLRWIAASLIIFLAILALYTLYLDRQISGRFVGQPWHSPARVYARAVELYAGKNLTVLELRSHLERLGYRLVSQPSQSGDYAVFGKRIRLITRQGLHDDKQSSPVAVDLSFTDSLVASMNDGLGQPLPLVELEPLLIGSIIPKSGEDRMVVGAEGVPSLLEETIIAIEDRNFLSHSGVDPKGIIRAAWTNLRAGQVEQGGSTITQQLIKSHFLSNEQTWRRKIKEALMALALDARMNKPDIMMAYINEIYLGQEGSRAIHGFDLASRFYFNRALIDLEAHQIATLVAIVRGPSYYNPRSNPKRALERRNQILKTLVERQVLSEQAGAEAQRQPLGVLKRTAQNLTSYPAFLALVKQQLLQEYDAQDLSSEGLAIHTTLDVLIQDRVGGLVAQRVAKLEKSTGLKAKTLQSAVVIVTPDTGEMLAIMGGRELGYDGFNRAVDMRRPIGSLIKPFVFLSALESGRWDLDTKLSNQPFELTLDNGEIWRPKNFSDTYSDSVPFFAALAQSINVPTVRLGLEVGLPRVRSTLNRLGFTRAFDVYPSMLLGAVEMSVSEVAQLYLGLAGNGFVTPIRVVNVVTSDSGKPLSRYPLELNQQVDAAAIYQIVENLKLAVSHGTGRALNGVLPPSLRVAGKTGSTNELRDSWFAGFSQDLVTVVWLGNDNNQSIGLTGSRGAMPIWADIMREIARRGLDSYAPSDISSVYLDPQSGDLARSCERAVLVPLRSRNSAQPGLACPN